MGKRQLSSIGQQLKEKYFFNCRYIAGNCCSRKRVGGLWSAIAINDQQLKEKKCISTDDTDGGPQADCFEERELWRIDRELKEIGPQADDMGEQQLSKIGQQLKEKKYISADDTEGHGR